MTQQGDPYENRTGGPAIAERVNGILKTDFRLNRVFVSFDEAVKAVDKGIHNYNHLRPHMSCGYLTPAVAHMTDLPLKKHWKHLGTHLPNSEVPEPWTRAGFRLCNGQHDDPGFEGGPPAIRLQAER